MNKENINNFIKYRANNSTIQKSVSCNKLTPSKCQQRSIISSNKNTFREKKVLNNNDNDKTSSVSRINSVMGTSETSYFNKNIEDFLLLKTQPNENLISSHNFPKNEKKEYFNDNAPNIYKEISAKMCVFKGKKGQDLENTITYMLKQYDRNKKNYFEFLQEKDLLTLRYLIQVLYDKLEFNGENKGKIEVLEQKIVDSQRNSSMLHDGILEKNIQFNTLSTKFYILLQKAKDFLWLIGETRKELKKLLFEEKNLLNYTRKTSLENLLKEFEILEKKMYEFEKEETKQENIVDESVFLKKLDKTRNQVKETFRSFFTEKPLKENIGILNSNSSLNLKTNERQIEKKNYELFEKELKKNQEKIIFLLEEKNEIEKNLYDSQLLNREFSSKLSELMHKYEEKDIEIKNLKGKNEEKNKEINQLIEKLNAFQENLSSENTLKDKKEAKLQLIEKELQEIKKLTDLKENEYYILELKNQKVEGDLQIALKTIKELQRNHDKNEGKINKNENKAELEAIVQYLSLIILSKPDAQSSKNEETICNLKNICGENFFKIMEELYLKINDYEFEADALKEKIKEQVKNKNVATQAALYFAKNLLPFFEIIEKADDERIFRGLMKDKLSILNEMKSKYMEVINELTFLEDETASKIAESTHDLSFALKSDETIQKLEVNSNRKKKLSKNKENIPRGPLNEKINNLSLSSLSENSNTHKINVKSQEKDDKEGIYLFLLNQATAIEQLLSNY